jgi:phosphatidylinositol 4-kinase
MSPSPLLRSLEPSPWESLTYSLATAVISLGIKHKSLRPKAIDAVANYLENCLDTIATLPTLASPAASANLDEKLDQDDLALVALITVSLLGFMEAAAANSDLWSTPERLQMIKLVQDVMSEEFLVVVETAFSSIRNSHAKASDDRSARDWRRYTRHYAAIGRPLGAMLLQKGFMTLILSSVSLLVAEPKTLRKADVLDILMDPARKGSKEPADISQTDSEMVDALATIASQAMALVEDGADYVQIGTAWQQRLSFTVKAYALTSYTTCVVLEDTLADPDTLMTWLEETVLDSVEMADEALASVVLRCMAVLASASNTLASNICRALPRFIVKGAARGDTVKIAAQCLAYSLGFVSHDTVISTLYLMGNVLSSGDAVERGFGHHTEGTPRVGSRDREKSVNDRQTIGSAISLNIIDEEATALIYANVVHAIVVTASRSKDDKTVALALSMLVQKIGKISTLVDASIVGESAILAISANPSDFKTMLKSYAKLGHDATLRNDNIIITAVTRARNYLSTNLPWDGPQFPIYATDLLELIISKGDIYEANNTQQTDVELAAREIAHLLKPLARMMAHLDHSHPLRENEDFMSLCRDAWFNIVAHGFTYGSGLTKSHDTELRTMAKFMPSLIANSKADQLESEMDLNTVLRRGMSPQHTQEQRKKLSSMLPRHDSEIRGLSYPKVLFLSAAYLLETLRASSGNCSQVLVYFRDPALKSGDAGSCMGSIADEVMTVYLTKAVPGKYDEFTIPRVATQLAKLLEGCCHRIERVQQVASSCVDRIINELPATLCQRSSLFALLELLTLMWKSCLDSEIDEYSWKSTFSSARGNVTVELSDDYALRKRTMTNYQNKARTWATRVMHIAPLDVKGLLQTYLSEYDEDSIYGRILPGRSFALELGGIIPISDHRTNAIEKTSDSTANGTSDFIAQYTARQDYRFAEALAEHDPEWLKLVYTPNGRTKDLAPVRAEAEDTVKTLSNLEARILNRKYVPFSEIRDILQRAASVLCRSKHSDPLIIHYLVAIPFHLFNKQSIQLGISLWMGVINENARMQSRIIVEVAQCWETSVRHRKGLFNNKFTYSDPFFLKMEFAPTDKPALQKRQQAASDLVAPHFWLIQFLSSHFGAAKLLSPHVQRTYIRLVRVTLTGMKHATGHPLSRETRLQFVLFSLEVLRYNTVLEASARWRLKSQILSAALGWFRFEPRYSYGGNRLRIKAEIHLMSDILKALRLVEKIGDKATVSKRSLRSKQELLILLLENEQERLSVWLYPMDHQKRHHLLAHHTRTNLEPIFASVFKTAWAEDPSIAIHMTTRFSSPKLANDVRWQLINFPERALGEPEALQLLYGSALPSDVSFQLKVSWDATSLIIY